MADTMQNLTSSETMDSQNPKDTDENIESLVEELRSATRAGDSNKVEDCLRRGADVNVKFDGERTPLYQAVLSDGDGSTKVVEILLEHEADIETRDVDGETPLWRAVRWGNQATVQVLLKKNADVNAIANNRQSVLYQTIRSRNRGILRMLLEHGAHVDAEENPTILLREAVSAGLAELVRILVDKGADYNEKEDDQSLIWLAAGSGDEDSLNIFLEAGVDIGVKNRDQATLLHVAAKSGMAKMVKLLIQRRLDIDLKDKNGHTPLWKAIEGGSEACSEQLLSRNADIRVKDGEQATLLHVAAKSGMAKMVKLLIQRRLDIDSKDKNGHTPLWRAVENGSRPCVEQLLAANADPSANDKDNVSVFHRAVMSDDVDIVQLLLDESNRQNMKDTTSKVDINTKDNDGESPLFAAVARNSEKMVQLLLEKEAKFGSFDRDGDSELNRAVWLENEQISRILIEHGADVKSKNRNGETPLHWASLCGDKSAGISIGRLLIENGADIVAVTEDGETALHYAARYNEIDFMEFLFENIFATESVKKPQTDPHLINQVDSTLNLEQKDIGGRTPLLTASAQGFDEAVALLLKNGANVNARDHKKRTALHLAAEAKSLATTKVLLPKMTAKTIVATTDEYNTALHLACRSGVKDVVKELLDLEMLPKSTITEKNNANETPFSIAAKESSFQIAQLFINHESDVVEDEKTKLHMVKEKPESSQIKLIENSLLESSKNLDIPNEENAKKLLYWAVRHGRRELVKDLLPVSGSDLEKVLYWAAVGGQQEIVKDQLQKIDGNQNNKMISEEGRQRAVLAAAFNGYEIVAQSLIQKLAGIYDFKFIDDKSPPGEVSEKWTPLHWAVSYKSETAFDVVRYMLMYGANPDSIGNSNKRVMSPRDLANRLRSSENKAKFSQDFRDEIVDLLDTPFRHPPRPVRLQPPILGSHLALDSDDITKEDFTRICNMFHLNIIDFYQLENGLSTLEKKRSSVYEVVYDKGPEKIMSKTRKIWNMGIEDTPVRFRWLHLPVNNWIWAEDLMCRVSHEAKKSAYDYTRLKNFVEQNRREHIGKTQSRFMYPAMTFESRDFYSGENTHILKLPSRDKKFENEKGKKSALSASKAPVTVVNDPAKDDKAKPEENKDEAAKTKESKVAEKAGQPASKQPILNQTSTNLEQKPKAQGKGSISHLEGCKMVICLPFLTFRTVKDHRELRQAIRLSAEIHKEVSKTPRIPLVDIRTEELQQAIRLSEVGIKLKASQAILEDEIEKGDNILQENRYLDHFKQSVLKSKSSDQKGTNLQNPPEHLKHFLKEFTAKNDEDDIYVRSRILEWQERFQDAIEIFEKSMVPAGELPRENLQPLLQQYLRQEQEKGLHASRTLDQYYYSSLSDTSRRDIDQVVRRYQCRRFKAAHKQESSKPIRDQLGRETYKDGFQIGMVDQLWLWVIDDKTVITCFPESWGSNTGESPGPELLDTIRKHIHEDTRPRLSSIYHLSTMIASFCAGFIEECKARVPGGQESFLDMFASSISMVANREVECFEAFKCEIEEAHETDEHKAVRDLDLQDEIKLLEEIKDIRDELNILRNIFEDQKEILQKLFGLISGSRSETRPDGEYVPEKDPVLNYYQQRSDILLRIEKVKKMQIDATTIYDSINHLLDLKQKNANVSEAVQARKQAEEATKQGRTILVFTIVTIIFLPLSFLTSLYALNVEAFPHVGDDFIYPSKWIFSRIFGTSAAIAIPMILIAIHINGVLDQFHKISTKYHHSLSGESETDKKERLEPKRQRTDEGERSTSNRQHKYVFSLRDMLKRKRNSLVSTPSTIENGQVNGRESLNNGESKRVS